jgi:hypothetical protein
MRRVLSILFTILGIMIAIIGWLGTSEKKLMLFVIVTGLVIAAVSVGFFFQAKWAKLIVGILVALLGLSMILSFLVQLITNPTALTQSGFGRYSLTCSFTFLVLFGVGLVIWGIETTSRVFRKKKE